jgi:hypothetical protein
LGHGDELSTEMGIWGKMGGVYDGVWVWAQDENHSGSDIWAFATMYVRIGTGTSRHNCASSHGDHPGQLAGQLA